jgi:hypothetical protein
LYDQSRELSRLKTAREREREREREYYDAVNKCKREHHTAGS